jgi:hypothetical protein
MKRTMNVEQVQIINFTNEIISLMSKAIIAGNKEITISLEDNKRVLWCKGTRKLLTKQYFRYLTFKESHYGNQVKITLDPPQSAFYRFACFCDRSALTDHDFLIAHIGDFAILNYDSLIREALERDAKSRKISKTSIIIDTTLTHWNKKIKNGLKYMERQKGIQLSVKQNESKPMEFEIFIYPTRMILLKQQQQLCASPSHLCDMLGFIDALVQ